MFSAQIRNVVCKYRRSKNWETKYQKLLGGLFDRDLEFDEYVQSIKAQCIYQDKQIYDFCTKEEYHKSF